MRIENVGDGVAHRSSGKAQTCGEEHTEKEHEDPSETSKHIRGVRIAHRWNHSLRSPSAEFRGLGRICDTSPAESALQFPHRRCNRTRDGFDFFCVQLLSSRIGSRSQGRIRRRSRPFDRSAETLALRQNHRSAIKGTSKFGQIIPQQSAVRQERSFGRQRGVRPGLFRADVPRGTRMPTVPRLGESTKDGVGLSKFSPRRGVGCRKSRSTWR